MNDYIKLRSYDNVSKYFLAPINIGCAINGNPTSKLIKFHDQRSGSFIGISYVGNVSIDKNYVTNSGTLFLDSNSDLIKWQDLAITISGNNSLPGIQIACRASKIPPVRAMFNAVLSQEYIIKAREEILNIESTEIEHIINRFIETAICLCRTRLSLSC